MSAVNTVHIQTLQACDADRQKLLQECYLYLVGRNTDFIRRTRDSLRRSLTDDHEQTIHELFELIRSCDHAFAESLLRQLRPVAKRHQYRDPAQAGVGA